MKLGRSEGGVKMWAANWIRSPATGEWAEKESASLASFSADVRIGY